MKKVMLLQQKIANQKLKSKVGKIFPVLIDGNFALNKKYFQARTATQAPEVDGVILIDKLEQNKIKPRSFQMVRISKTLNYDMIGEIIS